jgi:hypothetical protein
MNDRTGLQIPEAFGLDAPRREAFGAEFSALLAERTERYGMGESSSVRLETAESLARGILYCVELHLRAAGAGQTQSVRALYEAGVLDAKRLVRRGKLLLRQAEAGKPSVTNIGLRDTLLALPAFFRQYDAEFFAQEIPCDIDYPLCHPVSERSSAWNTSTIICGG